MHGHTDVQFQFIYECDKAEHKMNFEVKSTVTSLYITLKLLFMNFFKCIY